MKVIFFFCFLIFFFGLLAGEWTVMLGACILAAIVDHFLSQREQHL